MLMDDWRSPGRFGAEPLFGEDRPQHLIEVLAVAEERSPEYALARRADLAQRAAAASVGRRRPRLEPVHADRGEREVERQLRAVDEQAAAPELRRDRESPLADAEVRV